MYAFQISASLRDIETCTLALRLGSNWRTPLWSGTSEPNLYESVPASSVFDTTALSLSEIYQIPTQYLAALLRASRKRQDMKPGTYGWDEVADEFKRLMTPNGTSSLIRFQ